MVVRVNSPLASGTSITNATYSIDSNETAPVAGAAVSTTVSSAPLLSVSKTDSPDPVAAGGNQICTPPYCNPVKANAPIPALTYTNPANTTFVSATAGGVFPSGVVPWSVATPTAPASGSVQLLVRLNFFFFNDTATTEISTLSLPDALPILAGAAVSTTVSSAPLLSVSKTDSPDPVAAGGN